MPRRSPLMHVQWVRPLWPRSKGRTALNRRTVTLILLATALAVASSPATASSNVVAYGRSVDGVCQFASDVQVPTGYRAYADSDCRLLVEPYATASTFGLKAGADELPKSMAGDPESVARGAGGVGGGVGGPSVYRVDDLVGPTPDASHEVNNAASSQSHLAVARMMFFNERSTLVYDDQLNFEFRRYADGSMVGIKPNYGMCATPNSALSNLDGRNTAPFDSDAYGCWGELLAVGSSRLEYSSGGTYGTRYGVDPLAAQFDYRTIRAHFLTLKSGFSAAGSSCTMGDNIPNGWWYLCEVREY